MRSQSVHRSRLVWSFPQQVMAITSALISGFLAITLQAQDISGQLFVISGKPPSVHVVRMDKDSPRSQTKIEIPENATQALAGPVDRFLYLIHDGLIRPDGSRQEAEGSLTIVDTREGRLVSNVRLGWNVLGAAFSSDRRYLLCFGLGRWQKSSTAGIAAVTMVDTTTNTVTATLRVSQLGQQVMVNKDASRLFVLGGVGLWPIAGGDKPEKEPSVLAAFEPPSTVPVAELKFPNYIVGMALSADEKWLYVLDSGYAPKLIKQIGSS